MRKNDHKNLTDLLALLVFGIFALCVAAVLLTGAGAYKKLTDRGTESYDKSMAVRYLTTRFHQAPRVQVEDFSGLQAMTVREEIGGRVYKVSHYLREFVPWILPPLIDHESAGPAVSIVQRFLPTVP